MSENPFRIGQRVRFTQHAVDAYVYVPRASKPDGWKGVVVGVSGPLGVRVLRDGYKTPERFHVSFWEPLPSPRRPEGRRKPAYQYPHRGTRS